MPADTTQPRRTATAATRRGPAVAARPASATHRRDPTDLAQLTATVWPGSQEPLLLLDVSRSVLPRLRPGFARDLTADMLVIPHHPHAHLSIHDGAGSLFLHDRILATASVPASWRAGDNAILAILPSPPPDPAARVWHDSLRDGAIHRTARAWHAAPAEDRFLTLLTEGVALVAEIDIRA